MENKMYKTYLEKLEEITSKAKGVELEETVKVELGLVDDIEKLFKQTKNEFKQIDSKLTALKKELNTALIHTINIDGQAKTIIKQAKELGVNDLVKSITSIQSKAEGLRKDYEPILKAIN